jgi:hypothetical protein
VQQIITELSEVVSEKDKIMVITKMVLNETKWLLEFTDIWRQHFELNKHLQDQHIDVTMLSEIHLKPHERVFIPNCHFYRTNRFLGRKGRTAIAVKQGIPHNHQSLPPLVSIESTGCYFQQSYKSPGHAWNNADITEPLSLDISHYWQEIGMLNIHFGRECFHLSGMKLLNLLHINEFET